jgi:hypothetical protein
VKQLKKKEKDTRSSSLGNDLIQQIDGMGRFSIQLVLLFFFVFVLFVLLFSFTMFTVAQVFDDSLVTRVRFLFSTRLKKRNKISYPEIGL